MRLKKQIIYDYKLISASPILKWAGGKSQLLPVINQNYPKDLVNGDIDTYIEPFVGGAAVFFDISSKYNIKKAYLIDSNPELIRLYNVIKYDVNELIKTLSLLENSYLQKNNEERESFFYQAREEYNTLQVNSIEKAAKTIFLNRTCFNGLYRVNKKGWFNVPFGHHKNPTILFADKLLSASQALQIADIIEGDFSLTESYINNKTFIYYDPPYRPVSKTSHFTSYSKDSFNDEEQKRLAEFYSRLGKRNISQLLSNSDPTNYIEDAFFDDLYSGFNIIRVDAKRMINSNVAKRGNVRELLIRNY